MSTQAITDYLTKQIFIERNVVTYRSLSRHFSLHVNIAKNELATYHHNAPYQSQSCQATFLISGTPAKPSNRKKADDDEDEDMNMDFTQTTEAEWVEDVGDEVPQTKVTIVNERDLEDAKALYDDIFSIHVYSISPVPLHDVDLICEPTRLVRNVDKDKGPEWAPTVGRLVGRGIKAGPPRRRTLRGAVAGPSNTKQSAAPEVISATKAETKEKPSPAPASATAADKPKQTGKINFFKKVDKPKETKDVKKEVKQTKEEPVEEKKRMFFQKPPPKPASKPASRGPSPAPSVASTKIEKEQPSRGIKRKSSVGLEARGKSPVEKPPTPPAENTARVKRRAIVSDDDESDAPATKAPKRKSRPSFKTESPENSEAEREAMAIMDLDDEQVEKVSRVPSTNASSNEHEDEDKISLPGQDEDVEMEDAVVEKPKVTKKRKPKPVVPVGRNGLKKVKVQKSRKVKDANGYMVTEDYSEWESVDEEAESPMPKTKPKPKVKAMIKREEVEEDTPPAPAKEKVEENEAAPKKASAKSASPAVKAKPAKKPGNTKTQKGTLTNFFGPKKAS